MRIFQVPLVVGALASTLSLFPLINNQPALADDTALYLDLGGGARFIDQPDLDVGFRGLSPRTDVNIDTGYMLKGAVGIEFNKFWRLEAELAYRANDFEHKFIEPNGSLNLNANGDVNVTSVMANLFFAIPLNDSSSLVLGGGVGWANLDVDLGNLSSTTDVQNAFIGGDENRFAWQLRATYEMNLTDLARLYVGYNYFAATGASFETTTDLGTVTQELDYQDHSIMAGMRIRF